MGVVLAFSASAKIKTNTNTNTNTNTKKKKRKKAKKKRPSIVLNDSNQPMPVNACFFTYDDTTEDERRRKESMIARELDAIPTFTEVASLRRVINTSGDPVNTGEWSHWGFDPSTLRDLPTENQPPNLDALIRSHS